MQWWVANAWNSRVGRNGYSHLMWILRCQSMSFKRREQAKNNQWVFGCQLRKLIVFSKSLVR
jgi:hypothetical protein